MSKKLFPSEKIVDRKLGSKNGGVNPQKVLIVDDDPDIVMLYSILLTRDGFETKSAGNGLEAYDLVRDTPDNEMFDLIVTDIQMPTLDGIELVEALRKENHSMPVLYITGAAMGKYRDRLKTAGMTHIIYKPFEYTELNRQVTNILDQEVIIGAPDKSGSPGPWAKEVV